MNTVLHLLPLMKLYCEFLLPFISKYDIDKLKNLMKNVDNRNMRLQFDLKWSTNLSNTLQNKNDKKRL